MNSSKRTAIVSIALLFCVVFSTVYALAWNPKQPGDYEPKSDYISMVTRKKVSCKNILGPRTMVALVYGQSNSANSGGSKYTPKRDVYVYYEGKCYTAADPLYGPNGNGGTVWSRLGDKLIDAGLYDKVLLVAVGVGGTNMARWTPDGDLYPRVLDAIKSLDSKGIKITHILWHQGESDNGMHTTKDAYKNMFMAMLNDIRKHGVDAPIYVAVATRCQSLPEGFEIQQAQRELVNTSLKIYPGAYSDGLLSIDDRHDACHFSDTGLDKHATLWLNAIKFSGQ
ncbi:MAG: sialate O-acetylesterase [bacterium]